MNKIKPINPFSFFHSVAVATVLGAVLFASACTTTKDTANNSGATAPAKHGDPVSYSQGEWWKRFGDAELNKLTKKALSQNLDLANMVARIQIAEQSVAGARRGQLPAFSAAASAELGKQGSGDVGISTEQYGAGLQTNWEIDIWGKLSSKTAAQLSELRASQAQLQTGRLSLAANVSRSYIRLRLFDDQIQLHRSSMERNKDILVIYEKRHQAGRGTEEEVRYQEAEIWRLEGELEELNRQRSLEQNILAELLAKTPGDLSIAAKPLRKTVKVVQLPPALSAQSYERRPDLIAADAKVRKAYHLEESARAARLPKISIGGSANLLSIPSSPTAWATMILPQISFPALDPQTKINLNIKEIDVQIAQNEYRQAANTAIKESVDALNNYRSHDRQYKNAQKRLALLRDAHKATQLRFTKGSISRLEVLDSERQLTSAEQSVLSQYAALLQDGVSIFTSIGGDF